MLVPGEKDPVGKLAERVAGALWGEVIRPRADRPANQDVNTNPERLRHAGRFAAQPAIIPDARSLAAHLLHVARRPIPLPLNLIADHAAQVARQVYEHRRTPFADAGVEDAAGV